MTPQTILAHHDSGQLWTQALSSAVEFDVAAAYQRSLAVRSLRIARGEVPCGFKIGFTNRKIWPIYQVYAPIWGSVYDTTLTWCDAQGVVSLANCCQPRIEPEVVFGMKSTPRANATLDELFNAIEWVAPGFEIVQSHLPDWKFKAADTVADGALHARLLVGRKVAVTQIADSATKLSEVLAAAKVTLKKGDRIIDTGCGANVLGSPLQALHYFLAELRQCPAAPDLMAGHLVTTGTLTDAWPVQSGEQWMGEFDAPLSGLTVLFC